MALLDRGWRTQHRKFNTSGPSPSAPEEKARDEKPSGVYYEQLSTLLLAELKRQHRELRRQASALRRLRAQVFRRR